jgi:hypothetical protein
MRVCVVRDARGPEGCTQGVGPGVILICAVAADWARGSAGLEVCGVDGMKETHGEGGADPSMQ